MSDLKGLKVGDEVLVSNGYDLVRDKIAKITPSGQYQIGDKKYRGWGSQIGGDTWNRSHAKPFDQELWDRHRAETRQKNMRHALSNFAWHKADASLVAEVYKMLPPAPPTN